jgi:hypothetical protein
MTKYNGFDASNTLTAVICTILFSATMLISAVGPARAAAVASPAPVAAQLA